MTIFMSSHIDWLTLTRQVKQPIYFVPGKVSEHLSGETQPPPRFDKAWDLIPGGMLAYRKKDGLAMLSLTGKDLARWRGIGFSDALWMSHRHLTNCFVSRLDYAIDLLGGGSVPEVASAYEAQLASMSVKSVTRMKSMSGRGDTLYLGSRKSLRFVRIYDKAAEMRLSDDIIHTRIELQSRDEKAQAIAVMTNVYPLGEVCRTAIKQIADFPSISWWKSAMESTFAPPAQLQRHESDKVRWLKTQVAPSFRRVYECEDVAEMREMLTIALEELAQSNPDCFGDLG